MKITQHISVAISQLNDSRDAAGSLLVFDTKEKSTQEKSLEIITASNKRRNTPPVFDTKEKSTQEKSPEIITASNKRRNTPPVFRHKEKSTQEKSPEFKAVSKDT